jgi:hypothetical protein
MSQREENKDGAATGEQISLEKAKEDKSPGRDDSKELSAQEKVDLMAEELTEALKKKGIKVRRETMKGIHITFHPKPPEK